MPALRSLFAALLAALLAGACAPVRAPLPGAPVPEPVLETAPEPLPLPAVPRVAREFRGAWMTPVWGGEWPSRPGMSAEAQRAELIRLLDRAQQTGLNAVIVHVRAAADAFYPTSLAPWSAYFSGTTGRPPEPFYDPLAFAIQEAHRRGLEFHAWFNPFRAAPPDRRVAIGPGHVAYDHPERVVRYGAQLWLDPGLPENRGAVLEAILEVVDRYDIDAVHLDDYFYPYLEQQQVRTTVRSGGRSRVVTRTENVPFADDASWQRYGARAGYERRADWRRDNINQFVRALYHEVKARKPWVAVGISPFGIWRPGSPQGITGLDAYAEIFADARLWWREGWVDYMAPQLYWPIDGVQSRFTKLDAWWREQNVHGRHLWPGLHSAREAATREPWAAGEIVRQIDTLRAVRRATDESLGHVHFRLASLREESRNGIGGAVRAAYTAPALTPAMPWLDRHPPGAPRLERSDAAHLRVGASDDVPVRWWLLQVLDEDEVWHASVHPAAERTLALPFQSGIRAIALTAVSRTGIEGPAAVLDLR